MNTMGMMEMVVTSKIEVIARLRRVPRPGGLEAVEALVPGDFDELKPERVQEWLSAQTEWRLAPAGTVLHRTRMLPTCEAAMHYASYVTSLATAFALPAKVSVTDRQVELSLFSPRQGTRFNHDVQRKKGKGKCPKSPHRARSSVTGRACSEPVRRTRLSCREWTPSRPTWSCGSPRRGT